ncbi:MAG: thiol reductant ABC exporter subunit CydC [Desulfobacteraceae bacterium]
MKSEPVRNPLRPFIAMMRRHWSAMAVGGLLSLLATLASIGLLSLSGWFIAATAYAGLEVAAAKAFNFFLPSIGVRLFAMMRTAARYGERVICHDATFRILETLRTWCYNRLEPLSPARLSRHHSGDLLTRIITDIDTLDHLYVRVLTPTAVSAMVVGLLVGFIGHFNPPMAALCGGLLVVGGAGIPFFADRAARSAAQRLNVEKGRLRTALVDGIQGLAALLACGAENQFMQRISDGHNALIRTEQRLSHVTGWTHALTGMVGGLAVVGVLFIGVRLISTGMLTGPLLALLVLAVMAGFDAVAALPNAYQYLGQTFKAAARLHEVTSADPAVAFVTEGDPVNLDGRLGFDGVTFGYDSNQQTVLREITFAIEPGEHIAVMGATGAGKSTLLYLLSRFEDPDSGVIRLDGRPLKSLTEEVLRAHLCIVTQKAHLFNGTIRDNLMLANPQADTNALAEALSAVQLATAVNALPDGLDTWVGESGKMLSGGQARRLTIARALLSSAPIWALDEPTEGLDTETATAMMDRLLERRRRKTMIMVTHRSEAVEQMDRVILLASGRIAAIDSPHNLQRHSTLYRRLMNADRPNRPA